MLNELYTFAEPVQLVPFFKSKMGRGDFTLLHTCVKREYQAITELFERKQ